MIFNKYSESKDGSVVGGYVSPSASSSGTRTENTRSIGLEREIWGQEDDGGDLDGDLTCSGNIYVVDNYDPSEDDDEDDELYSNKFSYEKPIPLSLADELVSKFDNDEGGNLYVKRQLVVDKNIQSPDIYGKTMYLDYNNVKTNILDLILPVGSIIMFNGKTTVPKGWAICNGSNGTPDLRGKFIKGVGTSSEVGGTGGSTTHTLTTNEIPSHNHSATSTSVSETTINVEVMNGTQTTPTNIANKYIPALDVIQEEYYDTGGSSNAIMYTGNKKGDYGLVGIKVADLVSYAGTATGSGNATTTTTTTTTIGNTGGGQSFNIEPPYYSLIYIMKIS